jgi:hypothetical protein
MVLMEYLDSPRLILCKQGFVIDQIGIFSVNRIVSVMGTQ